MATTKELLDAFIKAGVNHYGNLPTGTMAPFAGTTVPDGWLLCNGANVSRTTYSKLFAVIGTKWGAGDGSTTFTLPNCEGRFLEGTTSTSSVGTYLEAGLPNITGEISIVDAYFYTATGPFKMGSKSSRGTGANIAATNNYSTLFDVSMSNSIYSGTNLQPSALQVLMIIKI